MKKLKEITQSWLAFIFSFSIQYILYIFGNEADLNYDKIEATLLFPKMKSGFSFAINSKGIKGYLKQNFGI